MADKELVMKLEEDISWLEQGCETEKEICEHIKQAIKTIIQHKETENPWHTGTPTEEGWYLLECNIGNSDETYYATDYWNNEVGYWTVNRVIRWQKIKED